MAVKFRVRVAVRIRVRVGVRVKFRVRVLGLGLGLGLGFSYQKSKVRAVVFQLTEGIQVIIEHIHRVVFLFRENFSTCTRQHRKGVKEVR